MVVLRAGDPCTCEPGRYVRYVLPDVPGLRARIFCRDNEAGTLGTRDHPPPDEGIEVEMRLPSLDNKSKPVAVVMEIRAVR